MGCKCEVCGNSFPLKIQLAVHKRVKHPEQDPSSKDTQGTDQPVIPRSDESDGNSRIVVYKSAEELLDLNPALEPEDVSDVEGPKAKVTYKLKSNPQIGFNNDTLPIDEVKEMDLTTAVPKVSRGSSPTYVLSGATRQHELNERNKTGNESEAPNKRTFEHPQERLTVTSHELLETCSPSKGGRKSHPVKMDLLRKSSRIRSLSNSYNESSCHSTSESLVSSELMCVICSKVMSNRRNLILHWRSHHAVAGDSAKFKLLPGKRNLVRLEKPSLLKKFSCKKCGKKFSQFQKSWKHRLNFCGLASKYKCSKCSLEFRQRSWFYNHQATHSPAKSSVGTNGRFLTSKTFNKANEKENSMLHKMDVSQTLRFSNGNIIGKKITELKSFKCRVPGCVKNVPDVIELHDHIKIDHRVFMCVYCESVLLTQDDLDRHIDKRHSKETKNISEGKLPVEKPLSVEGSYVCDFCGKNFLTKVGLGSLQEHVFQMHSSEFPNTLSHAYVEVQNNGNTTPAEDKISSDSGKSKPMSPMTCIVCNKVFKQFRAYILHRRDHKLSNSAGILPEHSKPETVTEIRRDSSSSSSVSSSRSTTPTNQGPEVRPKRQSTSSDPFQPAEKAARVRQSPVTREEERKCSECDHVFNTNRLLKLHIERDACKKKSYAYLCELCPQGFSREASLRNHVKSQHEEVGSDDESSRTSPNGSVYRPLTETEKQRQCTICAKLFSTVKILNVHIATHHACEDPSSNSSSMSSNWIGSSPGTAMVGSNRVISKDNERLSVQSNPGLHLSTEAEVFKKPQAVAVISPQHPRPQGDQLLKCNECGDLFSSNNELVQHLLWHNETKGTGTHIYRGLKKVGVARPPMTKEVLFKCVICGGGFRKKSEMFAHVKVRHTRRGVYACMECNKRFQRAMDLVDHSVIHEKEFMSGNSKEYVEDEEEEEASEPEEEEEADYSQEEEIPYQTTKTVERNSSRVSLSRNHSQATIRCTKCPSSFSNNKDFRIHWQSHSVREHEKNYVCPICKLGFSQVGELNDHRQKKHPENKVFICPHPNCNIPFVHQLGLKRHLKDHHGQRPVK